MAEIRGRRRVTNPIVRVRTSAPQFAESRADATACGIAALPTHGRLASTVLRLRIDAWWSPRPTTEMSPWES